MDLVGATLAENSRRTAFRKMAHVEKYTRAQAGHLIRHNIRDRDEQGQYISFGRSKIDPSRTAQNYRLDGNEDPSKKLSTRLSEIKVQKRADVKVYCSWVVTMPPEVSKGEERKFFESTYRFLANRYGEKNVICASVHMDETTPHLHFAFVPAIRDKKHPEREKCSAKEVLNPRDLKSFNPDLQKQVERDLGHSVSILLDDRDPKKALSNLDQREMQQVVEKAESMVVGVPRTLTEASATKATREANRELIERAAIAETALREADRQKRQAEQERARADERQRTIERQANDLSRAQAELALMKRMWEKLKETARKTAWRIAREVQRELRNHERLLKRTARQQAQAHERTMWLEIHEQAREWERQNQAQIERDRFVQEHPELQFLMKSGMSLDQAIEHTKRSESMFDDLEVQHDNKRTQPNCGRGGFHR